MNPQIGLESCLSFVNCQLRPPEWGAKDHLPPFTRRSITISRQSGSGGHSVARKLLELLQAQTPSAERPWTVFDRELVAKVIEDHNLPKRLAKFMPEDRISEISDTMDELFGLHPSSWTLVHKVAETILRVAELGHAIIIGRGANVITRRLPYMFHVRLVGSLEKRIRYIQELNHSTYPEAVEFVRQEDLGRQRYLRKYFDKDINDPLLYHLIINTDLVSYEEAAAMIAQAVGVRAAVPLQHAVA